VPASFTTCQPGLCLLCNQFPVSLPPRSNSKTQLSRVTKSERTLKKVPAEGPSTKANTSKKSPPKRRKISRNNPSQCENNTAGLAIFPDELLLEILSYCPDAEPKDDFVVDVHFVRRETLMALSQTCRNLRRFVRSCMAPDRSVSRSPSQAVLFACV